MANQVLLLAANTIVAAMITLEMRTTEYTYLYENLSIAAPQVNLKALNNAPAEPTSVK